MIDRQLADLTQQFEQRRAARGFVKWISTKARFSHQPPSMEDRDVAPFHKAAVEAMSAGNDAALRQQSMEFVRIVERRTILGQLPGVVSAPPFASVPTAHSEPDAVWVAEGAPAPVTRLSLTGPTTDTTKLMFIEGFSKALVDHADDRALNLIERKSVRGLRLSEDRALLDDNAAVAFEKPQGLLYNLAPVGAGSPAEIDSDLADLWLSVRDGDPESPAFVLSARAVLYLTSLHGSAGGPLFPQLGVTGGSILGAPAIVSRAAGNKLVLIDGACLAVVDDGLIVERSGHASVVMDDTPTSPAELVSGFQVNAVFVRFIRYLSWTLTTDDAVAYVELPIGGSPA